MSSSIVNVVMRKLIHFCVVPLMLAIGIAQFSPLVLAQAVAEEMPDNTSNHGNDSSGQSMDTASDSVAEAEETTEYVGEMYQIGLGWHPAALEGLPTDKFGLVNWVEALEQGLIKPRANVDPKVPDGIPFDMNIVMPSKTGMIGGAYFPHKIHTTWMSCDSCHTKIFMPLAGSNDLTMSTIVNGQACGVCHGKVAFPLNDCTRCHLSNDRNGAAGGSGQ